MLEVIVLSFLIASGLCILLFEIVPISLLVAWSWIMEDK